MRAIIVGHGPSVLVEPMGHLIDEFDVVIRLKRCQDTLKMPEHYGTKTDIVGGSLNISGQLKGIGDATQYWIFVDSRHEKAHPDTLTAAVQYLASPNVPRGANDNRVVIPNTVILDKDLCDTWDAKYRSLRDYLGEKGHAHTSQGFKAIVYALEHLKPDELVLVGFDNVMSGEFTWSITRGPDWTHYPDHNWRTEHELLKQAELAYPKTKIGFLLPEAQDATES